MSYNIKILESNSQIFNDICKALLPDLKTFMDRGISNVKKNLPSLVRDSILSAPEYMSLVGGQLRYELGLVDASSKIEGILNIWTNNIQYEYTPPIISGKRIKAQFSASLIRTDFSDVLYTDYAQMTDTLRGYSLPWLEWLLLDGSKSIIDNYEVIFGSSPYSRTGSALMIPSNGSWSVPNEYAGTIGDNWITRAIDLAAPNINNLLIRAFKS